MNIHRRRAVAYIAYRLVSGKNADSILDTDSGDLLLFSGRVTPNEIDIHDFERGASISGTFSSGEFSLTDLDDGSFFSLKKTGNSVEGWDMEDGTGFEANVSGDSVSVFDTADGSLSLFTV